jgi:CHASE3 domain sensor protein
MNVSLNSLIVILGIALLAALVAFLELHVRRSRIQSLARRRRTRVAANEALRTRLERKASRRSWKTETDHRTNLKAQLAQGQ